MDFTLTADQAMIRDMAKQFAEKEVKPLAQKLDKEGIFPLENIKKMAELGLLGMNVPTENGGSEVGAIAYSLAISEFAKCCGSTTVIMAVTNMVAEMIHKFGNPAQKAKFLPKLLCGELPVGSFALTEANYGSDAAGLKSTAIKKGSAYILNGNKAFITNGKYASLFLILAKTDMSLGAKGITAFIVEKDSSGLILGKEEEKMGLHASSTVSLTLDNLEVPEENILGKSGDGFKIAMTALDSGRIGIASQATGYAIKALDLALEYSKLRTQFNEPISAFQAIQLKLADMYTTTEAGQLLALKAAFLKDKGENFSKAAAAAKLFCSENANKIVYEALQIHGGYGFTKEYEIERLYRDVRVTTIYEGTSEIQRIVIAKQLLK